jgi:putative transposase
VKFSIGLVPRANRYILPGYIYHLTHRCHDRKFLLKFAKDRDQYRRRLRHAVKKFDLALLGYNITSNHVHLVAFSDYVEQIASVMQSAAGEFARDYNRRKKRSGAYWEGRYHATIVDSGKYFWDCLKYVELNMVRCGVVKHPREWEWSGYGELVGQRKRNSLLNIPKLLELLGQPSLEDFRKQFEYSLVETMANDQAKGEEKWTQCLAVGSREFVEEIEPRVRNRQQTKRIQEGQAWVLREDYS